MRLFKFIALAVVTLFFVDASAQQSKYKLFIYNKLHNSYWEVKANTPYQVWLNDTNNLKGYFDEVYESTFLFVTKDSTYTIAPESVNYLAQISGFGPKAHYAKRGSTVKYGLGVLVTTFGTIMLVPSAISAFFEKEALILVGVSAAITTGGILLIKSATNESNLVSSSYHLREFKEPQKLRIIKTN